MTNAEEQRYRHQALNLMLALTFYNGTFGVLSQFYFPFRSDILVVGLALLFGLCPLRRRPTPAAAEPGGAVGEPLDPIGNQPPAVDA